MIEIYTDGAFNPISQQGGWAAVILENGQKYLASGTAAKTTNNRMEITAALEGLQHLSAGAEVTVYTDSQYLFGSMARGWKRQANRDLWEQIDRVAALHRIKWEWINQNVPNAYQKESHIIATALANPISTSPPTPPPSEPAAPNLTHLDASGRPKMVDVSAKPDTKREATAKCIIAMKPETFALIKQHKIAKGDVLTVAQLAGIMGAKQTPYLIPLCHPLLIGESQVEFRMDEPNNSIEIISTVKSIGKTGVEIEALTTAAIAALTIYDMCKSIDRGMIINNLRMVRKSGGKSGTIELE